MSSCIKVDGHMIKTYQDELLTPEALLFLEHLHTKFNSERLELLLSRKKYQEKVSKGELPNFREESKSIRGGDWKVVPAPTDLNNRRVEITGPVEQKMMINALNSGAKVFMADLEDATSPSWTNMMEGQINLKKAVRRKLDFTAANGKSYKLNKEIATLVVRPRGWHLEDAYFTCKTTGEKLSASLVDFGLYFFHNAKELLKNGSGPYFYLPKLEHYEEARLWNKVFIEAQDYLKIPQKTIRATVLIETITAAFQMEEILYELRDHIAGLNAGRWDYIFSFIKKFHKNKDLVLPDRSQITMAVPFMQAYSNLLVRSCHNHGAHAIGGMSAFIPNRKMLTVTEKAMEAVQKDKDREALSGFDGTWVAHPDLVSVAQKSFDAVLGDKEHQKHILRNDVEINASDLLKPNIENGEITELGIRINISVALQYCEKWLGGLGAVAINNLMEDAATAEISRAQLWQWIHHKMLLADGRTINKDLYQQLKREELEKLKVNDSENLSVAENILDELVLKDEFTDFLTLPAYQILTANKQPTTNA